jgi:hypothetical protein
MDKFEVHIIHKEDYIAGTLQQSRYNARALKLPAIYRAEPSCAPPAEAPKSRVRENICRSRAIALFEAPKFGRRFVHAL